MNLVFGEVFLSSRQPTSVNQLFAGGLFFYKNEITVNLSI